MTTMTVDQMHDDLKDLIELAGCALEGDMECHNALGEMIGSDNPVGIKYFAEVVMEIWSLLEGLCPVCNENVEVVEVGEFNLIFGCPDGHKFEVVCGLSGIPCLSTVFSDEVGPSGNPFAGGK